MKRCSPHTPIVYDLRVVFGPVDYRRPVLHRNDRVVYLSVANDCWSAGESTLALSVQRRGVPKGLATGRRKTSRSVSSGGLFARRPDPEPHFIGPHIRPSIPGRHGRRDQHPSLSPISTQAANPSTPVPHRLRSLTLDVDLVQRSREWLGVSLYTVRVPWSARNV